MGGQALGRIARGSRHHPLGKEGVGIGEDIGRRRLPMGLSALVEPYRLEVGVVAEIGVAGFALQRLQPREQDRSARVEGSSEPVVAPGEEARVRRQGLEAAPLDPAIGEIRAAAPVRRAVVREGQAVELGIEEGAVEGRPVQHPGERGGVGGDIGGARRGDEMLGLVGHSFNPVLAMPLTKLRRRNTNRVMLGISTTDEAALSRPRSIV